MSIDAFQFEIPGPVAYKSSKDKTYEENMKCLCDYDWAITETVHDKLKLARDYDRETVACNITDAHRNEIKEAWEKKEDYKVVAERVFKKYYEANKDEIEYYPQMVEKPKVGDLVMATNGIPHTDDVYALGKIAPIQKLLVMFIGWKVLTPTLQQLSSPIQCTSTLTLRIGMNILAL